MSKVTNSDIEICDFVSDSDSNGVRRRVRKLKPGELVLLSPSRQVHKIVTKQSFHVIQSDDSRITWICDFVSGTMWLLPSPWPGTYQAVFG